MNKNIRLNQIKKDVLEVSKSKLDIEQKSNIIRWLIFGLNPMATVLIEDPSFKEFFKNSDLDMSVINKNNTELYKKVYEIRYIIKSNLSKVLKHKLLNGIIWDGIENISFELVDSENNSNIKEFLKKFGVLL